MTDNVTQPIKESVTTEVKENLELKKSCVLADDYGYQIIKIESNIVDLTFQDGTHYRGSSDMLLSAINKHLL